MKAICRPNIRYHCDINTDPFLFMEENDKVYCGHSFLRGVTVVDTLLIAFVLTVYEISATIPSLWKHVRGDHPQQLRFVSVT
jgi:alpha 1,2-mannosyltransferase